MTTDVPSLMHTQMCCMSESAYHQSGLWAALIIRRIYVYYETPGQSTHPSTRVFGPTVKGGWAQGAVPSVQHTSCVHIQTALTNNIA